MPQKRMISKRVIAKLITLLVIFILLIIFAIQNFQRECRIKILFWDIEPTPISVIVFVSILIGALIAISALFPHLIRLRRWARSAEAEVSRLKAYTGSSPADDQ